ncbi:hypothetical protein B484DRAFT_289963, partial [Ochromonadaceae sp. CCMP2298]
MLRLQRQPLRRFLQPRYQLLSPLSNKVEKKEKTVKDAKALASLAVKLIPSSDLEVHLRVLQKFHSDASARNQIAFQFIKHRPTISSSWLGNWICKVLLGDQVKLFPLAVPDDHRAVMTELKTQLAQAIFGIKTMEGKPTEEMLSRVQSQHYSSSLDAEGYKQALVKSLELQAQVQGVGADIGAASSKDLHLRCLQLADTLGNSVLTSKLRETTTVFQDFMEGQMSADSLLEELDTIGGVYTSELQPILEFIGLDVPPAMELSFRAGEVKRDEMREALLVELTYIVHMCDSDRFSAAAQAQAQGGGKKKKGEVGDKASKSESISDSGGGSGSGSGSGSGGISDITQEEMSAFDEMADRILSQPQQGPWEPNTGSGSGSADLFAAEVYHNSRSVVSVLRDSEMRVGVGRRSWSIDLITEGTATIPSYDSEAAQLTVVRKQMPRRVFPFDALHLFSVKVKCFNTRQKADWQNRFMRG